MLREGVRRTGGAVAGVKFGNAADEINTEELSPSHSTTQPLPLTGPSAGCFANGVRRTVGAIAGVKFGNAAEEINTEELSSSHSTTKGTDGCRSKTLVILARGQT